MKRPELLAPAGNLEKARVALAYGADAIYLGGQQFGLRARAGNFTPDEIEVIVGRPISGVRESTLRSTSLPAIGTWQLCRIISRNLRL